MSEYWSHDVWLGVSLGQWRCRCRCPQLSDCPTVFYEVVSRRKRQFDRSTCHACGRLQGLIKRGLRLRGNAKNHGVQPITFLSVAGARIGAFPK